MNPKHLAGLALGGSLLGGATYSWFAFPHYEIRRSVVGKPAQSNHMERCLNPLPWCVQDWHKHLFYKENFVIKITMAKTTSQLRKWILGEEDFMGAWTMEIQDMADHVCSQPRLSALQTIIKDLEEARTEKEWKQTVQSRIIPGLTLLPVGL